MIAIKLSSMLSAQRKFWELPNFIKCMVGGYGSGKTHIGAKRAIWLSYVNRPYPGKYVSPTYPQAEETIIATLIDMLDKSDIDYTYSQTKHKFTIHEWGGHIWIGSGEKPDSLKGPNLAWAAIDEPFIQKKDVFKQMNTRIRVKDAPQRELFLTGTPEQLNWGYDLIHSPGDMDVGVVFANTRANFHNSEDYVKNLEAAYSEEEQKAYLDGQFLNLTQGRVYKDFDRSMLVERKDLQNLPIECGMDFNVDAMSCEIYRRGPGWIHFFDEIRMRNANTYDMADALHKKYPGITIFPDASGGARKTSAVRSDHAILRDKGFRVVARKANPAVKDRVNAFNKLMRDGNCSFWNVPFLISDMERNTWRSGDIDKRDPEQTHSGDAGGYPIAYNFPVISRKITQSASW